MAYRNGTYVAFHAEGTPDQSKSDIRFYRMMTAWSANKSIEFAMTNSHEKTGAVRDSSKKDTLKRSIQSRLANSKNMVLIIGETTRYDRDWVPFEITQAVERYSLPIIASYPDIGAEDLTHERRNIPEHLWPTALKKGIAEGTAGVVHVPFSQRPLMEAIEQFGVNGSRPEGGKCLYTRQTYKNWGVM